MRTVIIGVGNPERGDDGVGIRVAEMVRALNLPGIVLIDAQTVPENCLGPVIEARPDRILFVDACRFSGEPGEFRLFDRSEFDRLEVTGFSTHTPPLNLIAELLAAETGAEVYLLGINPSDNRTGTELSPAVRQALPEIVSFITTWTGGV
ncbi:MAG: hydrogenase 3 maturation endopeptidase HyCI [candidate division WOR-3 bacterium]|uniref:Hydrogenase 3 maturation endopeptidase HyCI n=1 Tax=candidate division WOR-3 bacterium TaxID=2052148 RepID=A0A7C3IZ73_UNCW3|nr:hydrogenase 3 maturation endopeptidase HyCI [candidate division WOR-3 bacterium]